MIAERLILFVRPMFLVRFIFFCTDGSFFVFRKNSLIFLQNDFYPPSTKSRVGVTIQKRVYFFSISVFKF